VTLTLDWVGEEATPIEDVDLSSTEQRDRINKIKSIVTTLEADYDEGAPIETILNRAEADGIDRDAAEREIDKLRRQGDVYEPTTDHLRLV